MHLSESLRKRYTQDDNISAREAQRAAEFIAWGPAVFQTARLMLKYGILEMLRNSDGGMTRRDIVSRTALSDYAVKCLLEASLSIGLVLVDDKTDRFTLSKTGWFLINDPAVRVNIDFNNDVNYEGWFHLDESFKEGRPAGLRHFGPWPTLYAGLSKLPPRVLESWLAFDHFYSDSAFDDALRIVFEGRRVRTLYDVGGNTGKWALRCVGHDDAVKVVVLDLPQQIEMMRQNISGKQGAGRISGYGIALLDSGSRFPESDSGEVDAIWMSQFLDCFSMPQITDILKKARSVMSADTRLFIMETLWDRQKYEPAALCLTLTSLYFTAMANGNSKMYNTEDIEACISDAGLEIEKIYDHLGQGHSILVCKAVENV